MKIAELISDYSKIVKKSSHKLAFVPNPDIAAQQQQQQAAAQQQQAAAQQAQPQPQQAPPQAPAAPQQSQQAPPQGGQGGSLMDEVMAVVQQLPPQVQQQIAPMLQQLQSLPPDQREQHLAELLQQLQQGGGQPQAGGQPQQAPPQQGMVAQASDEDLYAAMQGMQPGGEAPPMEPPQDTSAEDAEHAEASAVEAKNELDNVRVSLTVRELLDLVGKGTATASLLKVKQLADTHKQKMDQNKQKADAAQQEQSQKSQEAQQGMMSGGIYPTPMGGQ